MIKSEVIYRAPPPPPETWRLVARGFLGRCPRCGQGHLFGRFLKVASDCDACGLEFHHHRADDFPPYIVMFVVGHLLGYGIYTAETRFEDVPVWFHAAVWPTLAVGLCLGLLQPVKGAVVALQYALGMHGFGSDGRGLSASGETDGERRQGRAPDELPVDRGAGAAMAEPKS